ncbi:MAG: LmeA family phospholipid-binding protein [Armatimonadota bacterium]|nr:LmeA family phospholipid-binding protein [Armatimonadota bacterium]
MRRARRRGFSIIGWFAVAIVAAGAVALWLVAYTPPEEPAIVTPDQARQARSAVHAFGRELEGVEAAAAKGKRRPFRAALTQEDLTTFLQSDKSVGDLMSGRKLENPNVKFDSQEMVTSAYVTVHGRRLHVTVRGKLSQTSPGKLAFRSSSVMLGRLPAPSRMARKVDEAINAYLSFGKMTLPAQITEIKTDDGELVLAGTSDPDAVRR